MKRGGDQPAMRRDLEALEARLWKRFGEGDLRMETFEKRMSLLDKRMERVDERMDTLESVVKRMAAAIVNFQAEMRTMREDFASAMTRMESRLLERMDGFMSIVVKVDRGQTILVHRVDKLEERVGRLERRPA
ncbi:MAG: hypothetical protein HY552_03500 [Elusimicrobia bacterium]|nr:hypothetical protein [Elusimicrobiota bacterium]